MYLVPVSAETLPCIFLFCCVLYLIVLGLFWASTFGQWVCSPQPITAGWEWGRDYKIVAASLQDHKHESKRKLGLGRRGLWTLNVVFRKPHLTNPTHSAFKVWERWWFEFKKNYRLSLGNYRCSWLKKNQCGQLQKMKNKTGVSHVMLHLHSHKRSLSGELKQF